MTSELEQQFFETFGIEEICTHTIINPEKCKHRRITRCCGCDWLDYPDITAEKLLVLLCIVIDEYNRNGRTFYLDSTNVKELKEEILDALMGCIDVTCDLFEPEVKQVQQLFKEEE